MSGGRREFSSRRQADYSSYIIEEEDVAEEILEKSNGINRILSQKEKEAEENTAWVQVMSARGRKMIQERRTNRRQQSAINHIKKAKARRRSKKKVNAPNRSALNQSELPARPKSSVGLRRNNQRKLRRAQSASKTRKTREAVWARLARPKTNSRSSDEPFVRPELKKWGIYPGQLTPAEDPEPAENPARPPYDTHFHPGQHKQRRKRRVKKVPRRTVRRKPKKKSPTQRFGCTPCFNLPFNSCDSRGRRQR